MLTEVNMMEVEAIKENEFFQKDEVYSVIIKKGNTVYIKTKQEGIAKAAQINTREFREQFKIIKDDKLPKDIALKVESDLMKYPDWLTLIEVGGLGSPSHYGTDTIKPAFKNSSSVEMEALRCEETEKKVQIIEKVFERLHGEMKNIIEFRYFQQYETYEVIKMRKIKKWKYYDLKDRALECFARALGYIE